MKRKSDYSWLGYLVWLAIIAVPILLSARSNECHAWFYEDECK